MMLSFPHFYMSKSYSFLKCEFKCLMKNNVSCNPKSILCPPNSHGILSVFPTCMPLSSLTLGDFMKVPYISLNWLQLLVDLIHFLIKSSFFFLWCTISDKCLTQRREVFSYIFLITSCHDAIKVILFGVRKLSSEK